MGLHAVAGCCFSWGHTNMDLKSTPFRGKRRKLRKGREGKLEMKKSENWRFVYYDRGSTTDRALIRCLFQFTFGEVQPIGFLTYLSISRIQNRGVLLANVCPTRSLKEEEGSILKLETKIVTKQRKIVTKKRKKYQLGTLG